MNSKEIQVVCVVVRNIIILLLVSTVFSYVSLHVTKELVNTREELTHVEYGWPVQYATQNQDRFDPPLPYEMGIQWETPTTYSMPRHVLNISIYFIINLIILNFLLGKKTRIEKE